MTGDDIGRRVLIFGVEADERIEEDGCVFDGSRHRSCRVLEHDKRRHACAADEARRHADADQVGEARRQTDRSAGVFADPDGSEVGGNCGAGPAARASGVAIEGVRVQVSPPFEEKPNQEVAKSGRLVLARTMPPCAFSLRDRGRVALGDIAVLGDRAEGRHDALGFDLVLDDDGNPVKRTLQLLGLGELAVKGAGLRDGTAG